MSFQPDSPQSKVLGLFEGRQSIFLTGKAGTGKSILLSHWRETTKKKIIVLAPTGVAAINVDGQTIHSFFGFQPGILPHEAKSEAREIKKEKLSLLRKLDAIVIDEVSMVRSDLMDAIDIYLSEVFSNDFKNNKSSPDSDENRLIETPPFGGIQIIFIGDLFQLSPVVTRDEKEIFKEHYPGPYFFQSQVFRIKNFHPVVFELEKIYRQKDDLEFQEILNSIRNREITPEILRKLNRRVESTSTIDKIVDSEQSVYLTSQNKQAQEINESRLKSLKSHERHFKAEYSGDMSPANFPTDEILILKRGARVMFVKNDHIQGWVNGTMGTVEDFITGERDGGLESGVGVRLDNGESVMVYPELWEISRYRLEKNVITRIPVGSFVQLPLKLAWALTIHKSQGKTFPKLIIDLSKGMFAHGQAYVALSRGTALEGISLTHPLRMSDVKLDYEVVRYFQTYHQRVNGQTDRNMIVKTLNEAVRNQQLVLILYLSKDENQIKRKILPKKMEVMEFKGNSFLGLIAFCQEQKQDRIFSVDRILKLKTSR